MAIIRLTHSEAAEGYLPETCMKCGAQADHWVRKRLTWRPSWVWVLLFAGLAPYVIVAIILTKRATLIAPLCTAHRRHWFVRTAVALIGLFAIVGIVVLLIAINSGPRRGNDGANALFGLILIFGFFAWLIALVVMKSTSIRAAEITDYDVILQGVSEEFADDLEDCIEAEERDDDRPRSRSHPRRDARDDENDRRR